MIQTLSVNGKFYSASMTGVHRVAEELLVAMDALLSEGALAQTPALQILLPRNAKRIPNFANIPASKPGLLPWIWWEQLELPLRLRSGVSLNLCNLGPLASKGGVTMIHDAQIYTSPESYSRAFVAWYKIALPTLGRNSRRILTVSEYSRDQLAAFGVAPREKISVVPNGVDHMLRVGADNALIGALDLQPQKYVLGLANTQAHKNIPLLFKAFEQLADTGIKLVLLGGAGALDFAQIGAPPPSNVIFAGRVSDEQMRGLMEQALCFACPSLTEGFGLPPLEAMLLGCPSMIAPCGALPEVCAEAAIITGARDPEGWAAAIKRVAADTDYRANLASAGIAQAQKFTWRKSAEKLLQIIQEVDPADPGA